MKLLGAQPSSVPVTGAQAAAAAAGFDAKQSAQSVNSSYQRKKVLMRPFFIGEHSMMQLLARAPGPERALAAALLMHVVPMLQPLSARCFCTTRHICCQG
jgi:hypothetical protein